MTRPINLDGSCPTGTRPCATQAFVGWRLEEIPDGDSTVEVRVPDFSAELTPDNIYCYPDDDSSSCPITELKIESKVNADLSLARGATVVEIIENESYIVFSSNQTDSKPPTT